MEHKGYRYKVIKDKGDEDYKDKQVSTEWSPKHVVEGWETVLLQVLILGGGDGALLCELLKHQPAKV